MEAQEQDARREARKGIKEHLKAQMRGSTAELPPELAAFRDILREQEEEFALQQAMRRVARDARREEAKEAIAPEATTISSMFHAYSNQEGMKPSTVAQFRSIVGNLTAFLGHNDATRVAHADIIHWLEHLRTEPIKRGKAAGRPRSAQTINESYLAAVKAVFAYGRQALLIDENPLREVKPIRAAKRQRLRDPDFTQAERETILSAALEPIEGNYSAQRKLARRWVPWICAYTGARVNEITQLRREDIQEIEGIWTLRITPVAGSQKSNAARIVPLHKHLLEQGFVAAVRERGEGPLFYEPERGRGGVVKPQAVKVGQWLAKWVRQDLGITDPGVQPNHAWRHTFKTICREVEIDEGAADYIQGHASKAQGRRYGSNTLPALVRQLSRFPRLP